MKRSLYQILKEMYPKPGDLPIWTICPDDPDVCILTTLGEHWSWIYEKSRHDWEAIYATPSEHNPPKSP